MAGSVARNQYVCQRQGPRLRAAPRHVRFRLSTRPPFITVALQKNGGDEERHGDQVDATGKPR